jgi:hypothetical protein
MLISYGIVMFLLTTSILVYFLCFFGPMDLDQKMIIGLFCFLGYLACSIVFYTWNDERKMLRTKKGLK